MKRTIYRILSLVLCLCLLPVGALAASYTGDVLLVYNPDLTDVNGQDVTFTPSMYPGARDLQVDPETGAVSTIIDLDLPDPVPVKNQPSSGGPMYSSQAKAAAYEISSTRSVYDNSNTERKMECLYIGTYCTVWSCTNDTEVIRLSAANAERIGKEFDANCQKMVASFGDWWDADGDGKLAIFCYDIDNTYKNSSSSTYLSGYTGGFFYSRDLIDENSHINQIQFYSTPYAIGMDCIHLDTYPTMGNVRAKPFSDLSGAYSTLYHEMQHLINFNYRVSDSSSSAYTTYNSLEMPTYLDEAFAMGAEHLICGSNACTMRVDYFSHNLYTGYTEGSSLTHWYDETEDWLISTSTLSHYSNAYLFGQYLRTRYSQKLNDGTDGSTFFKTVLSGRTNEDTDTLAFIADLLDTTKDQLMQDFWSAVYLKRASGPLGFAGETWANRVNPKIYSLSSLSSASIGCGGAMYFDLAGTTYTPRENDQLRFVALSNALPENGASMEITNSSTFSMTVTSDTAGSAAVGFYDTANRFLGCQILPLTGTETEKTVNLTETRFDLTKCTWKIMLWDTNQMPICPAVTPQ